MTSRFTTTRDAVTKNTRQFGEVLPNSASFALIPRAKEPLEALVLSEVPLKEKHELGIGHGDDCGNDTLVNRGTDQTEDVATERRNKNDAASGSDCRRAPQMNLIGMKRMALQRRFSMDMRSKQNEAERSTWPS